LEVLAISASPCFHVGFNASTKEVHMNNDSATRDKPMVCAAPAAADRTLLD
jgi:hypothetical protein